MGYRRFLMPFAASFALLITVAAATGGYVVVMPGKSHKGPLPSLTEDERELGERLRRHVATLAGTIGERNIAHPRALAQSSDYIVSQLTEAGLKVHKEEFAADGAEVANLVGEITGSSRPEEIVVVGAHYDSAPGTPGANDNASGVAALIEIARVLGAARPARTVRFVSFVNEEPPYFLGNSMGSLVYARKAKERGDRIVAMLSIETIGYYSDRPKSQDYPAPFSHFYPDTGNFIAFVSDLGSRKLLHKAIGAFRETTRFPSEGVASPDRIPGVGWSDHWSFWQAGYPALMITDTAPFRYPHYHEPSDTPDKLNYDSMTRVVHGIGKAVTRLAND